MMKLLDWFALQKFRFDLAGSFMTIMTFMMVGLDLSYRIASFLDFGVSPIVFSCVFIVAILFCVWLAGFVLDRVIRYQDRVAAIQNERNGAVREMLRLLREGRQ